MKHRFASFLVSSLLLLPLTGCSRIDYSLPEHPTRFVSGTFTNPDNPEDQYASIEYQGRTYIFYDGGLKGILRGSDVKRCLGYLVREDHPEDQNDRVYLLTEDPDANYLMTFYVNGEMENPLFYRATDTVGQNIKTPSCIDEYTREDYEANLAMDPSFDTYWK